MNTPEENGHILYKPEDFPSGDDSHIARLVVEGGLAVCKKCYDGEAGLEYPCKERVE